MNILIKDTNIEDLQRALLMFRGHEIMELPNHGNLIDESEKVDALYYDEEFEEWTVKSTTVGDILYKACEMPPKVVIPAERSD